MTLKQQCLAGIHAAFSHFKIGNHAMGAAAFNPGLSGGSSTTTSPASAIPMTVPKPNIPSTAPMASAAPKSNVLG